MATGLGLGLLVATGLSAWVTVQRLSVGTAPFDRLGTTYHATVALYYVGASVGGALVGLMRPLARSPLGALLLGVVGVFPLYFGVALSQGENALTPSNATGSLVAALLVGGSVGIWAWLEDDHDGDTWLDRLRNPTTRTVKYIWISTVAVATGSYLGASRVTGSWPFDLVLLFAFLFFVVPIVICALVTRAWLTSRTR